MRKSCNTVAEKRHLEAVATRLQKVLPTFANEISNQVAESNTYLCK